MTAEETLAGSPTNPGIVALEIITAGTFASTAFSKGTRPTRLSVLQGGVEAGMTSVLPVAPPSPGKCSTTGTTPPA